MFSDNIASQKVCSNNEMVLIETSAIDNDRKRCTMAISFDN